MYRPLAKHIFALILTAWGPSIDITDEAKNRGAFTFADTEEKLIKNARVVCKRAEGTGATSRQKFITGLTKSGYWVPGVAWENTLSRYAMNASLVDEDRMRPTTDIEYRSLAGAV